jgi:hypothetical protein
MGGLSRRRNDPTCPLVWELVDAGNYEDFGTTNPTNLTNLFFQTVPRNKFNRNGSAADMGGHSVSINEPSEQGGRK